MEATSNRAGAAPAHKPFFKSLYFQVLTAILLGVLLGHYYPQLGEQMKPLGDAFIKMIKMIIAPIIFCTVVLGIASMERHEEGRARRRSRRCFTSRSLTTLALIIGLVVVNMLQPGVGMNIDPTTLDTKADARLRRKVAGPRARSSS